MRAPVLCIVRGLPSFETGPAGKAIAMAKYFVAALFGLASLTGCRMCACPYDDCYPVVNSQSYQPQTVTEEGTGDDDYAALARSAPTTAPPPPASRPHLAPPAQ